MSRNYPREMIDSLDLIADAVIGLDGNSPLASIAENLDRIATALEELLDRQKAAEEREREGR